jgi:Ca2+-binding EF-hand superfamily protein
MLAIAVNIDGSVHDRLDWIFSAYDVDDNGYIDHDELKKIIRVE